MADVARQPRPDLTGALTAPEDMGFFELLRRLEQEQQRFGRTGGPSREPARLGQRARMTFGTRDVAAFDPGDEKRPARVDVEVLGLIGPEGAMPLHLTRWIMGRLSERWFATGSGDPASDTTFLDFCNLLQHRMIALYWRAWADARPEVQVEHGPSGRVQALIDTLAGIGLPGTAGTSSDPQTRIRQRHATSLGRQVYSVERLTSYLRDVLQAPVALREFVGSWTEVPARLQSRLGRAHAELGRSTVIGARSFQRQALAELRVGPLSLAEFRGFLADGALLGRLRGAIRHAMGRELEFDLRLVLHRDEVPALRLGASQLGRTAWLAPTRAKDVDDLRLYRVAGTGDLT